MSIEKIIDELEKRAYHSVSVSVLKKLANPFSCWQELEKPITKKEVMECIKNGNEELVETPLYLNLLYSGKTIDLKILRENHIKKIAYFVKNKPVEPLGLDVGIPGMCYVDYIIDDGNHRFAAMIIRGEKEVSCTVSGSVDYIKELNLWNPNDAYLELDKMYEIQDQERKNNVKLKI